MNLISYVVFLKHILSIIPFSVFDYVVIILFSLYIFEDASFGLIASGVGFFSTVSAFFLGLILYHPLSRVVVQKLSLTKGISDAFSFLLITVIFFVVISLILSFLRRKYLQIEFPKNFDKIGGGVFGFFTFFFVSSFVIALLLSFPLANVVKDSVRNSVTGKYLFSNTQGMEYYVRQVFGGAIEDTINFLTIEPTSNDSIALNFKTDEYTVDNASEKKMLTMVNMERAKVGRPQLVLDDALTALGRTHAKDMLARGYFSHYTPEGLSPFDRMEQASIYYNFAGENLAFAPDVNIAMDGLMKSPGHKANILSGNFKKVGIGILDAGVFGKMFVQEFTN